MNPPATPVRLSRAAAAVAGASPSSAVLRVSLLPTPLRGRKGSPIRAAGGQRRLVFRRSLRVRCIAGPDRGSSPVPPPSREAPGLQSPAEGFVQSIEGLIEEDQGREEYDEEQEQRELQEEAAQLQSKLGVIESQLSNVQVAIDELFNSTFAGTSVTTQDEAGGESTIVVDHMSEQEFALLGRSQPKRLAQIIEQVKAKEDGQWREFQSANTELELQKESLKSQKSAIVDSMTAIARQQQHYLMERTDISRHAKDAQFKIVLITGFEAFNGGLFKKAAQEVARIAPQVSVYTFSDRDLVEESDKAKIAEALDGANIFFGSLLFDYDQVEWVKERIEHIPIRLVFESALELMSYTEIGTFNMKTSPGQKKAGPPAPVRALLAKFGSGREEDKLVGYLSFLKIGPKLLRFIPGKQARHLRNWLTVYSYWTQGGLQNVTSMLLYLAKNYLLPEEDTTEDAGTVTASEVTIPDLVENPPMGLTHPLLQGQYIESPAKYLQWHRRTVGMPASSPVVGVILYKKHVITKQGYIDQLILSMEQEGLIPVPIFINGVEAHTIVRDSLTTRHEQEQRAQGVEIINSLKKDAVLVDAVVNTVGFPLVGGPAGSIEAGRQVEIAKQILGAKNIPYFIAAPLIIQDILSWKDSGVGGLQQVVLYALPELDGAIDTVTIGALVGEEIVVLQERIERLCSRVKAWVNLRALKAKDKKLALMVYGFPPGVGATGTAALLNVPKSLEALLSQLKKEGYNLGETLNRGEGIEDGVGQAIIDALTTLDDERLVSMAEIPRNPEKYLVSSNDSKEIAKELLSKHALVDCIDYETMKQWLGNEIGLRDGRDMLERMECSWGDLREYRGIKTTTNGLPVVSGLQLGNLFIGVQPLLGVEGDPMRMLFERDLTPHPQYVAFYKWLQESYRADAMLHFGMHGTSEWLPGSPLGNTVESWSDQLIGNIPNVYIYAANNPSESIVAKRRGYGTIVSHNVPPYARAGLYKQLASLRELLAEYREDPENNQNLQATIADSVNAAGLQKDCPMIDEATGEELALSAEVANSTDVATFEKYAFKLSQYLQLLDTRLFSEGLHTLGGAPTAAQTGQYLEAYYGSELSAEVVAAISEATTRADEGSVSSDVELMREKLEKVFELDASTLPDDSKLQEALDICSLLGRNTEELSSTLKALEGQYVLPAPGGDLLRDGPGVLPTGRNIHALDPYRMPSPAAAARGAEAADKIIEQHRAQNEGAYPETVAVNLWGLDAIKTKGESVAIVLQLVGARTVKESTGRVARYELLSLDEMGGRPRIDVLMNMSGIFRDSFANVVDLLDDLMQRAAEADEPDDMNFIKKHSQAMQAKGITQSSARIFSNPVGDYGSMVNERVGTGEWESSEELGNTWVSRNAFSYGRGGEKGVARPDVLGELLSTTDRIVQEIDSVEYGLTDIQEYYANTGALKAAAENAVGGDRAATDSEGNKIKRKVGCSIVETFSAEVDPRELEDTLRMEYRTKLLNPKWAEAMASQGSGGAYEISQRMTAMVGWGGTVGFQEDWTYDQALEMYVEDKEMAERLRKNNPQAFSNVLRRFLEAAGRGMWDADAETIERLKEMYNDLDSQLEGQV